MFATGIESSSPTPVGLDDLDRNIRAVGQAYKQLIADWQYLLPARSICLTVPLVMPSEYEERYARRRRHWMRRYHRQHRILLESRPGFPPDGTELPTGRSSAFGSFAPDAFGVRTLGRDRPKVGYAVNPRNELQSAFCVIHARSRPERPGAWPASLIPGRTGVQRQHQGKGRSLRARAPRSGRFLE